MAAIREGIYRIENTGFDSETRVLDLKGSNPAPGTPVLSYPSHGGDNQKWSVTKIDDGYNFQAVNSPSNIFVGSIGPGVSVTGSPIQRRSFKLRDAGANNRYHIIAEVSNEQYAFEAPDDRNEPVVLQKFVASNFRQVWRFVFLQ